MNSFLKSIYILSNIRRYTILIIVLLIFSTKLNAENNNYYKYYLYFDFNKCTSCDITFLKYYISEIEKLNKDIDFNLITKTLKNREFEAFKKNFNYNNIINDTAIYSNFISSKTLPAFFVANNEGRVIYCKDNLKEGNLNLNLIQNNFKTINIDKYQNHKLLDSALFLYRPSPPILNKQKDNFVVLDRLDQTIKEFNIKSGQMKRIIEIDSNLQYFLIKDSVEYYRAIIPEQFSIDTKFSSPYYDNSNNIIVNAKAFEGLSGTLKPKQIKRKYLKIKYIDNQHYNISNLNDSIAIYDMINTKYSSICLVERENTTSYDLLKSGNYSLISLLDSSSFSLIENKISYKDLFNYYNINHFIYSHGVICQLYEGQYAYLNPWNGIFFTFQDSIQDSMQIRGYLELLISDNPSALKYKSSNYDYKYKVMSLSSYNGKAMLI